MSSPRRNAALAVACGLLSLLAGWLAGGPPDLRPVMPEMDGVHPVLALQALHDAYTPGVGFPDKYPPLGSFLFGLAAARADSWFAADAGKLLQLSDELRHARLWELRDRVELLLDAERWVSRVAMAAAVALLALLALAAGAGPAGAVLAALLFLLCWPALYYGGTTNVDALALAASLLALWFAVRGRWAWAGMALGLAVAIKDPAYVLAAPIALACWRAGAPGRARRLAVMAGSAALIYALAAGALTSPAAWWQHLSYLLGAGVAGVDRIDFARPGDWWLLARHTALLLASAIGWSGLVLGAAGLWRLSAQRSPAGRLLAGALAATLLLFVLPVGFVFARFLLLPLAALAVGAGCLLEALARRRAGLLAIAASLLLALLMDRHVADFQRFTLRAADPRRQAVDLLARLAAPGSRITCFADEREAGPPLDPVLWRVQLRRLVSVNEDLPGWRAGPARNRPEFVVWMGFPTDLPSGRGAARVEPPSFAGLYEVIADFGEPGAGVAGAAENPVERVLAVRPWVEVLRRVGG